MFPEGIFIEHNFSFKHNILEQLSLKVGHYILSSNDQTFLDDAYFQGFQTSIHSKNQRLVIFPSLYLLRNIPNIPDGNHAFNLNYSILHLGSNVRLLESEKLIFDFDFYQNVENYQSNDDIPNDYKEEKMGYSLGIQYGTLREGNDWKFKLTYTTLQRYAALDFMAQNDWARWDYSAFDSPDGRLTNLKGIELVAAYNLNSKTNLVAKYYLVRQLIATGSFLETGQRIRLDLNVKM